MGRLIDESAPRTQQSIIVWRAEISTKAHAYLDLPGDGSRGADSLCGRMARPDVRRRTQGAKDDDYCKACLLVLFDAIPEGEFDMPRPELHVVPDE